MTASLIAITSQYGKCHDNFLVIQSEVPLPFLCTRRRDSFRNFKLFAVGAMCTDDRHERVVKLDK